MACVLDDVYRYSFDGGLAPVHWWATLRPPDSLRIVRYDLFENRERSCTTVLPRCGDPGSIDGGDVAAALSAPDVVSAWGADVPVFGNDERPMDGSVWVLRRGGDGAEGSAFAVGSPCRDDVSCIPGGLLEVRDLLEALLEQQVSLTACAALAPG